MVTVLILGNTLRHAVGESEIEVGLTEPTTVKQLIESNPEQLGGLSTPRLPCEISEGRVLDRGGRDVTEEFRRGAEACLAIAELYGCRKAILKAKSPSCGSGLVYDGTFSGRLVPGDGITAALLKSRGIEVVSEEEP